MGFVRYLGLLLLFSSQGCDDSALKRQDGGTHDRTRTPDRDGSAAADPDSTQADAHGQSTATDATTIAADAETEADLGSNTTIASPAATVLPRPPNALEQPPSRQGLPAAAYPPGYERTGNDE